MYVVRKVLVLFVVYAVVQVTKAAIYTAYRKFYTVIN